MSFVGEFVVKHPLISTALAIMTIKATERTVRAFSKNPVNEHSFLDSVGDGVGQALGSKVGEKVMEKLSREEGSEESEESEGCTVDPETGEVYEEANPHIIDWAEYNHEKQYYTKMMLTYVAKEEKFMVDGECLELENPDKSLGNIEGLVRKLSAGDCPVYIRNDFEQTDYCVSYEEPFYEKDETYIYPITLVAYNHTKPDYTKKRIEYLERSNAFTDGYTNIRPEDVEKHFGDTDDLLFALREAEEYVYIRNDAERTDYSIRCIKGVYYNGDYNDGITGLLEKWKKSNEEHRNKMDEFKKRIEDIHKRCTEEEENGNV